MANDRMLAMALATATGAVSMGVVAAALDENATAAVREESRLVFASPVPDEAGFIGGLTGADLLCREAAAARGLKGVFLAWLGDGVLGPANRFEEARGPLVNVRGERVADGWRQLAAGRAQAPVLHLDGRRNETTPWTNVGADGTSGMAATACDRWWHTGRRHAGAVGIEPAAAGVASCDSPRPFFCVEQ